MLVDWPVATSLVGRKFVDVEGAQPATAAAQHNARIILDISGISARDYGAGWCRADSRVFPPLTSKREGWAFT